MMVKPIATSNYCSSRVIKKQKANATKSPVFGHAWALSWISAHSLCFRRSRLTRGNGWLQILRWLFLGAGDVKAAGMLFDGRSCEALGSAEGGH